MAKKIREKKLESKDSSELYHGSGKSPLEIQRHSTEHVMAMAIMRLWPKAQRAIGPAIEDGFYQDFFLKEYSVKPDDFLKIEAEMEKIRKERLPFVRSEKTIDEALKVEKEKSQGFKTKLIKDFAGLGEKKVTYYTTGEYVDLCKGPHVEDTSKIGFFKLDRVAGAYWRGDEKNPMLQRVYGLCFATKKELEDYIKQREEAEKRDHRKLGQELDLFSISQLTGPGLILWHPKLAIVRNVVEQFWKEVHVKNGYQLVFTPHIAGMDMFVKTRHYTKYINSMFPAMLHQYIEGESKGDYSADEQLKPMNCPNHVQIFKVRPRSYRELPFRMGELGTVYRYERAGVLHGLTRVRGFTQDDSHIFCSPDQVIDEVRGIIRLTRYFYEEVFGFRDYQAYLSTRPEKYLGSIEMWEFSQNALKKAMELENVNFKIDEGAGVFYGPKIDSKVKDSLGREWQLGTIQFDFNLPTYSDTSEKDIDDFWELKTFKDKFKTRVNLATYLKQMGRGLDVKFIDKDGKEKTVVMIHRTILGSMERFFGVLIEHYGGAFPLWLSPVQLKVIPISDKHTEYGDGILKQLKDKGLRAELDDRPETMQAKIRDAQLQKIPYMLVVGDREKKANKVAVRLRTGEDLGQMTVEALISRLEKSIASHNNL